MLFPTIDFAIFFAVVFPLTWLLNANNMLKKWFLVAASYFFYGFWSVDYLGVLFASSFLNYIFALRLGELRDGAFRRFVFWLAVSGNLGVLVYFKYYNFFAASANDALTSLGLAPSIGFVEVALPIAISFLTFHALSYIIDVYRREVVPTRWLVDMLLYISFFPHLVAGPIVRAKIFLIQADRSSDPKTVRIGSSAVLILGGLFKKVVIANYLATDFVDPVFQSPGDYSSLDLLLGMYGYALQIYCDFSAYTDIAIGIANLLGYHFPQNFNQPYRATSLRNFWQRWHITLSTWLRDYLYIPLGGSRGGRLLTYRNLLVTMGLGGLWHGASVNFVIWGLMHGSWLVAEPILGFSRRMGGRGIVDGAASALGWVVTFHFVCVAWVFFRSSTLAGALSYLTTIANGAGWDQTTVTPWIAVLLALGALTQLTPSRLLEGIHTVYERAPLSLQVAVPAVVIFLISAVSPAGVAPFIYFQF